MKTNILAIIFVLRLGLSAVEAGEVDSRFRGIWVGEETFTVPGTSYQFAHAPFKKPAVIAIGEKGKMFGVLQGLNPGRYYISPWSKGNKLIIKNNPDMYGGGRFDGAFVLSADGNTITETGNGLLKAYEMHAVNCTITGTFHRQAKK